ncbi:MAG TPA: bifunctional fucokinase/fucose-1-phosphate guanylyltransferase [Fimbriimonas sp.]|nr:bifunctional fucokinase/fucose-1-phosphate guanylyltransferase [Fimbriimonas sp.]
MNSPQRVLTLPPKMAESFHALEPKPSPQWFVTFDPDRPLGSGGGTAHALLEAWRAHGERLSFYDWLADSRKIVIHAGGQSRRLPAYATVGKTLMPIPATRGSRGQRPDQALVDLQVTLCDEILDRAPESLRVMIFCGDALLRPSQLPIALPEADVVVVGQRADAETASHFGAFFLSHHAPGELDFMLQKPSPSQTLALAPGHDCLIDVGIWLLSEAAVKALLSKSGITAPEQGQTAEEYDLYSEFGPALGSNPSAPDPVVSQLSASVVSMPGEFLHFGTSRQLVDSVTRLHDQAHHSAPLGFVTSAKRHPNQHVQNARFSGPPPLKPGEPYWIENSTVPQSWTLDGENMVTGVPVNHWTLHLPRGACLDVVPIGESDACIRVYGYDDAFKGAVGSSKTEFLGRPLEKWLAERQIELDDLAVDLQEAALFPVVAANQIDPRLIEWMLHPGGDGELRERWLALSKLSAKDLLKLANVSRLYKQRCDALVESLDAMQKNHRVSMFYSLDLEWTAKLMARERPSFMPEPVSADESVPKRIHEAMFRSELMRLSGKGNFKAAEAEAFQTLRSAILEKVPHPVAPTLGVAKDQIVWGRAPLRFDLAGGWTDTPPYCLLNGGRVLNVAVELNGQPPVQVFIRLSERRDILLRSIDLGTERRFGTFEELSDRLEELSEFSLPQAALTLAGFSREAAGGRLDSFLESFGGGIEMSLLSAVPKGSGLGTSSILASTVLSSLNEFCKLGWGPSEVMLRTLALEQMLGTGGGWQDQAGGLLPGIKDLETGPGLIQNPSCRWLPERILGPGYANSTVLLYYTGITRVAVNVLKEIVRGMFLNSGPRLATLQRIRDNVDPAVTAIQQHDYEGLGRAIRRSWELNQELDSGTNPPSVQRILDRVEDLLLGAKLLGAGGGGFLLMFAKDQEASRRVRSILESDPPSDRSRFFDFRVSQVGLEVTKS